MQPPAGELMTSAAPIHFAPSNGGRIAYQRFGTGSVPLVAVPPAAQNIETAWSWPGLASMFEQLGAFCDYIHFDKRGTGASDSGREVPGIDERVDDLRAVMDHAGMDRAHLFAQSEGGPMTLLFAAAYPDRVLSITLVGSGARLMFDDTERDEQIALREHFASVWGTEDSLAVPLFAPSMLDDQDFLDWHVRYERTAASAEAVLDLMVQMIDWDVRDVVPDITCPILVLHRTADPAMPVEFGREVAALARDATLVELEGSDHYCFIGESEWLDHLERFVTGTVTPRPSSKPPSRVEITTFGRFAVTVDGTELSTSDWGSRRARTLVKRLVAARGWPVRREELADLLWPDEPDITVWAPRLSVQLSTVRRVLSGGIIADRQTIALDLDAVDVDLVRLHESDDDDEIVATHVAPFLPEEAAEEWRRGPHGAALVVARSAAHRLVTAALDDHQPARAAELAQLLLTWDELDAVAHDAAVEAAEMSGDPAGSTAARARRQAALSG